jgi:hypothetical protein
MHTTALVQGPLSDQAVVTLLKEKFVCVQEVIPGAGTRPADLPPERRKLLERFARLDRFFFGTIRLLAPDGKNVLAELRSFPGDDADARKKDQETFRALANAVVAGQAAPVQAGDRPPSVGPRRGGPPISTDRGPPFAKDGPLFNNAGPGGFGPKKGGPKIGDRAPDFELRFLDAKKTFKLSDNFGKRPTVLIFHSFT